jgi:hypothetical protein
MNLVIEYLNCISYKDDCFAEEAYRCKKLPITYSITWFLNIILNIIKIIYCSIFGHKWADEGHATPEYGYVDMNCQRCGFSHGIEYLY